jgi:preprotein translocase subunit SecE
MSSIERFKNFLKEVRVEARKVAWPTREELFESTWVVLFTCLIITVFIFIVDQVVGVGVTRLLKVLS